MRISTAIRLLEKLKEQGETDVLLVFWERDIWNDIYDKSYTKEEFALITDSVNAGFSWSETQESLSSYIEKTKWFKKNSKNLTIKMKLVILIIGLMIVGLLISSEPIIAREVFRLLRNVLWKKKMVFTHY